MSNLGCDTVPIYLIISSTGSSKVKGMGPRRQPLMEEGQDSRRLCGAKNIVAAIFEKSNLS